MLTTELKQQILSKSFGGVMYDISEGSELVQLVLDNEILANRIIETTDMHGNGIDKGVASFISEVLARDMAQA